MFRMVVAARLTAGATAILGFRMAKTKGCLGLGRGILTVSGATGSGPIAPEWRQLGTIIDTRAAVPRWAGVLARLPIRDTRNRRARALHNRGLIRGCQV